MSIAEKHKEIDSITSLFKSKFTGLSTGELNWKPSEAKWSIGQNIHHLIVINQSYFPIIQKIREGNYRLPWLARFDFLVNFFGKVILNSVRPEEKRKIKTFPIWEPSYSDIPADILLLFEKHQEELKELLVSCEDLIQKGTVISSPANKNIFYKLDTAFDIIIMHERRHLKQAEGVLEVLTNNR